MGNIIDLHIHSSFSDGSDDCSALLAKIRSAGIKTFSITDHDSIDSCYAMKNLDTSGLNYVRGIEFSCMYNNIELHLLAYNFSLDAKPLVSLVNNAKKNRVLRIEKMLEHLQENYKIKLQQTDIDSLYSLVGSVGKPHVANILLKMGYGDNIHDIIVKYLADFRYPQSKMDVFEAIKQVKDAGGISVVAHPIKIFNELNSYIAVENIVKELKLIGLDGIEAYHSKHKSADIAEFCAMAKRLDLLITCGSDYHGLNKPDKNLADNTADNTPVDNNLIAPFCHQINI